MNNVPFINARSIILDSGSTPFNLKNLKLETKSLCHPHQEKLPTACEIYIEKLFIRNSDDGKNHSTNNSKDI